MAKRNRKERHYRKKASMTVCPPRCREGRDVERLREAVEVERENLSKAESVLGCLAIAMEYEMEGAKRPYYPDVAQIAREMVRRSVNSLDPLTLRRMHDKVEEEARAIYPSPADCLLTLDCRESGSRPSLSRDAETASSAPQWFAGWSWRR